jgi:hypothetical protein
MSAEEILNTTDARICNTTRGNYFGYITEIIIYFVEKERQREASGEDPIPDYQTPLTQEFFTFYQTIQHHSLKYRTKRIREALKNYPRPLFFNFDVLKGIHFKMFAEENRKSDGTRPVFGTISNKKSGFVHIWKMYDRNFDLLNSGEDAAQLNEYMTGLQNRMIVLAEETGGQIDNSRKPLSFDCFQIIARKLLCHNQDQSSYIFAHLHFVIHWNLICRSNNVPNMSLNHISWDNDAMQIFLLRMKNDQVGNLADKPINVYANPVNPWICPILSMGIFLAVHPTTGDTGRHHLLTGGSQDSRFEQILIRFIGDDEDLHNELIAHGFDLSRFGIISCVYFIGSHSIRKGGTSYVSASKGLPRQHRDFMTLPPHFRLVNPVPAKQILQYIYVVFGNLPQTFLGVAKYALASLVYHSAWLRENLPEGHILFKTSLFRDPNLLAAIKSSVVCMIPNANYPLQASGVPNEVYIREEIYQLPQRIEKMLDHRDFTAGQLTASAFNDMMNVLTENINNQMIQTLRGIRALHSPIDQQDLPLQQPETDPINATMDQRRALDHGDFISHFKMVPPDYKVPTDVKLKTIWEYWWMGDLSKNIMRFRKLQGRDFSRQSNQTQRFSDLSYLMKKMEEKLQERNYDLRNINNHMAIQESFEIAFEGLRNDYAEWFSKTSRRVDQLVWGSFCKPLRKIDKQRREERLRLAGGTRDDTTDLVPDE